jgi:hypothetical protein
MLISLFYTPMYALDYNTYGVLGHYVDLCNYLIFDLTYIVLVSHFALLL